jgi:hypothetical protein
MATPPPLLFCGKKGSNVLRDNRLDVVLAAHWHRSIQSADRNCKNFVRFIARFFTAESIFATLLQRSAKQHTSVERRVQG